MRVRRARWLLPVGVVAAVLVVMGSGCPPPAQPQLQSQVFSCTGAGSSFTVPAGVSLLAVHAYGAQGGSSAAVGGLGGRAIGAMQVTSGQSISVVVGCQGGTGAGSGGFLGGGNGTGNAGGGGGASAVGNGSVLFVGAGGGGGGDNAGESGGTGGFPDGGDGQVGCISPGGGGTQGNGGLGVGTGEDGTQFAGGDGGMIGATGAGGGSGFFGGGGAGNGCGGGGGSSTGPTPGTTFENGAQTGHGLVVLLWNA